LLIAAVSDLSACFGHSGAMRRGVFPLVGVWLMAVALAGGNAPSALADNEDDHDRARGAVERGDILPLETVLRAIRPSIDGEIVGIELEKEGSRWIYEIKVINRRGRMVEIAADARTAKVVKVEGE
jgi:uncharacterized membrane protein YkoI